MFEWQPWKSADRYPAHCAAVRRDAKVCSTKCRMRAYRRRQAGKPDPKPGPTIAGDADAKQEKFYGYKDHLQFSLPGETLADLKREVRKMIDDHCAAGLVDHSSDWTVTARIKRKKVSFPIAAPPSPDAAKPAPRKKTTRRRVTA